MDGTQESSTAESSPVSAPQVSEQPAQSEAQEQQQEQSSQPEGFQQVDLPPELKPRFNRIYKEMKDYQRETHDLRQINQRLLSTVDQLQNDQGQIISHLQNKNFSDAESQLSAQRQAAWDKGDVTAYNAANDKLNEIKISKALAEQNKPRTVTPTQQQVMAQPVSGGDALNIALQRGEISQDEAVVYQSWASETDDFGNLKRPWVNQSDIRNQPAAVIGRAVFTSPVYANKTWAEKLREVDRLMGLQPTQAPQQGVLPAGQSRNLTGANKSSNVKLTPYQEQVAVRTKFGGSKAKSDEDHKEAYRQAVIKSKRSR